MKRKSAMRAFTAAVVLCVATAAVPSAAQTDEERASARALGQQGVQAMAEKRWADAADLFQRADALVHAPPFVLYLARADVQLGKLVTAQETYRRLVREKLPPDAPTAFTAAQADGAKELQALEPRIPSITIQVSGAPSAAVTMDGQSVPAALVGVPHPIDPGEHKFQATAAGMASQVATVVVKEGGSQTVSLELRSTTVAGGPATPKPIASVAPGASAVAPTEPTATEPPPGSQAPSSGLRIAAYGSFGLAAAGVVTGVVLALQSHQKASDSKALCPGGTCAASDAQQSDALHSQVDSLDSQATTFGQLSVTSFVVGGAAAATGVTLLLLQRHEAPVQASRRAPVHAWIGPGSAGLAGEF
jgi:hypothetical protein